MATKCQYCNSPAADWLSTKEWSVPVCQLHGGLADILQISIVEEYVAANPKGPFTYEAVVIWWYKKRRNDHIKI